MRHTTKLGARKPRRPRWAANCNTMELASRRVALLSHAEIAEVMLPLKAAFQALRQGVATEWQWSIVASSMNCAQAIERQGVVKGLHEHLRAAELALQGIQHRAMATGEWRSTALYYQELDNIKTAVDLHEFQLRQLSHGEAMRAIVYAEAEVRGTGGRTVELQGASS